MANEGVAQEEVWDDSVLVRSWNEAYQEYLKYHSLAVKGKKVKVPTPAEETALQNGDATKLEQINEQPGTMDVDQAAEIDVESAQAVNTTPAKPSKSTPNVKPAPAVASIPPAITASIPNEEMQNLMMSWYYAGYYTGLHEGKQQGYASAKLEAGGGGG